MKVVVCTEPEHIGAAARAALGLARGLGPQVQLILLSAAVAPGGEGIIEGQNLGGDQGVVVVDPALDGVDASDLGRALAGAARKLGADLVLTGARSDGEGRGIVGAAIAHHLGAPYLPHIEALTLEQAEPGEVVVVLRAGGLRRRLAISLPAVLTVAAAPLVDGESAEPPGQPPRTVEVFPLDGSDHNRRTVEVLPLDQPADATPSRPAPAATLGSLERLRHKPTTVTSAGDLVKRWLG